MSFISSWIKVIFIIVLAFPFYSETALEAPEKPLRKQPDCHVYKDRFHVCSNKEEAICATNGHTYYNKCIFCSVLLDSKKKFKFDYYGRCSPD